MSMMIFKSSFLLIACHTNTSPKECNTIESKPLHESLDCTLSSSSDDEEERVYEALVTIAEESFTQECTTGEDEFSKASSTIINFTD